MKKQNTYLIAIIAVVAILGGWYLYDSGYFTSQDLSGGEFPLGIGTAKVICELNLADGTTVTLPEAGEELKVTNQEGVEVNSATIKLIADITSSGYDILEINLQPDTSPPSPSEGETIPSGLEDVTITHTIGTASYVGDIYAQYWTATYNQQMNMPSGQLELVSTNTDFNTAFESGDPYDTYHFCWQFDGDACYRPGTGTLSDPDWEWWSFVDLDGEAIDACVFITYSSDGTIDITWDYDLSWS